MDIKFIRDDTEERAIKELNEILEVLSSETQSRKVYAAKRFLLAMFAASRPPAEQPTLVQEAPYMKSAISRGLSIPIRIKERPAVKVPTPPMSQLRAQQLARQKKIPVAKPEAPLPTPRPSEVRRVEKKFGIIPSPSKEEFLEFEDPFPELERSYPLTILKDTNGVAIVRNSLGMSGEGVVYNISEPSVDANALGFAKDLIAKDVRKKPQYLDDDRYMKKNIEKALKKAKLNYSDDYADRLKYFLRRDLVGFGKVDAFLQDPNVRSVVCGGVDKPVRVLFNNGLEVKSDVVFSNAAELDSFVKYLSTKFPCNPVSGPNFEGIFNNWKIEGILGFGNISSKFVIRRP